MGEVLAQPRLAPPVEAHFPRFGSVDAVGLEARADELAALAVEREARLRALELAVALLELTSLQGTETPGTARELCAKAAAAPVAAVCVLPEIVPLCRSRLARGGVLLAAFVSPAEAQRAIELGADEIDVAIDGGAFLSGRYARVADEIARVKTAVAPARVKALVAAGALGTYDNVRRASLLAILGGADFVEAVADAAPLLPTALCILEAIRDVREETGRVVGFKASGGVGTAEQAIRQLVLAHETLGPGWLTPDRYRLGSSTLLDDLRTQIGAPHSSGRSGGR